MPDRSVSLCASAGREAGEALWPPAATKNPRGGCRRAQDVQSHFAIYSIGGRMSRTIFRPPPLVLRVKDMKVTMK
jgi:hypothetical protein